LIVAHRLTTARRCDVLVGIEKGSIAEYGSPEQLIAAHGLYARLWRDRIGQTRDTHGEVIGSFLSPRFTHLKARKRLFL
ncbi:hypothetical protein ACQWKP_24260, partial [Salmonella enterica subsp. enterica serovar Infantis]